MLKHKNENFIQIIISQEDTLSMLQMTKAREVAPMSLYLSGIFFHGGQFCSVPRASESEPGFGSLGRSSLIRLLGIFLLSLTRSVPLAEHLTLDLR